MSPDDVTAGLRAFLADVGVTTQVSVTGRATVGLSQETWFATVDTGAGPEDVVVRLPTAASGGRAIVQQRSALQAVAGADVPAPALRWWDDTDANPFGSPVLVMERLRGDVPAGWHELPPDRREALGRRTMEAMAALHAVDPASAPELRRPRTDPATDALDFHRRRLEQLGLADDPVIAAALWWLDRNTPSTRPTSIVHHDLRMGNLVVDSDRLVGILDWELAAVGDRHTDVVWCFVAVWEPAGVDVPAMYGHYAAAAGVDLDQQVLRWELVMAYLRLAYYAASGGAAFASGASDDLRLAALGHQLPVQLDRLTAALADEDVT